MKRILIRTLTDKRILTVAGAIVLYALAGFVAIPLLLRWQLPHLAKEHLHCQASVETIRINPFLLTFEAEGFRLNQEDGTPLAAWQRLFIDLELSSLMRRAVVVREVTIDRPEIDLTIGADGSLNWATLAPASNSEEPADNETSLMPFRLENVAVHHGQITCLDQRHDTPARLVVQEIEFAASGLSSHAEEQGSMRLTAATDQGTDLNWQAEVALSPLRASGAISLKGLSLAGLWPFVEGRIPMERPEGVFDIAANYRLADGEPMQARLEEVVVSATDLSLPLRRTANILLDLKKTTLEVVSFDLINPGGEIGRLHLEDSLLRSAATQETMFAAAEMTVANVAVDVAAQSLTIDRLALGKGRLHAVRDAEGRLDWQRLAEPKPGSAPQTDSSPTWSFLLRTLTIEGFSTQLVDLTTGFPQPVIGLRNLGVTATGIGGAKPIAFTVGFEGERGGTAKGEGTVDPRLPSVEAEITVDGLPLATLQPYIAPYINFEVRSGAVSTKGRLHYGGEGKVPATVYEGSFSLADLLLHDTDQANKPFLNWQAVRLPAFRLTVNPTILEAKELVLVKPEGELIIDADKTLNLTRVIKQTPATGPQTASGQPPSPKAQDAGGPPFAYKIGTIRIDKGNLLFADLSLRPQFKTRIHELSGTITGLGSAPEAVAAIRLKGQVDRYGMATINGSVRTNDFGRASTVELVFRNLDMNNLSPYSGRFAGRLIKSGKISTDLRYTFRDHRVSGNNNIVIDKLVLGDKVETPESANLPLDLAIALLQDGQGRITIGLPVSGDLNDPQFSIGSLVWKMITNLITKTVTSPFRALGSLFGSGEADFEAIAFAPGEADLSPPEKEKLVRLAEALSSRPQLLLVVQGRYSPEVDGPVLREQSLTTRVATLLGTDPSADGAVEPLNLADGKVRDILETLYRDRFGKEALDKLDADIANGQVEPRLPGWHGQDQTEQAGWWTRMVDSIHLYKIVPGGKSSEEALLWTGELFVRLAESEELAEPAFSRLADRRARAVANHLQTEAKVPADRVRLDPTEPLSGGDPPAVTLALDSR